MAIPVTPGGFQLPMTPQQQFKIQNRLGNAGNGGRPNPPTIVPQHPGSFPRVNLHPQFHLGAYNNAERPNAEVNRFNRYWTQQYNTNNPIGVTKAGTSEFGGVPGNAGNGDNDHSSWGAGYKQLPWIKPLAPQLGVLAGISDSFPYNPNSTSLDGQLNRVWQFGDNVNMGEPTEVVPGMPELTDIIDEETGEKRGVVMEDPEEGYGTMMQRMITDPASGFLDRDRFPR